MVADGGLLHADLGGEFGDGAGRAPQCGEDQQPGRDGQGLEGGGHGCRRDVVEAGGREDAAAAHGLIGVHDRARVRVPVYGLRRVRR